MTGREETVNGFILVALLKLIKTTPIMCRLITVTLNDILWVQEYRFQIAHVRTVLKVFYTNSLRKISRFLSLYCYYISHISNTVSLVIYV